MTHAWCRDVQRDEAVRASEDGRPGPLPTLEEAIATASPLPGRVEGTHWADWERLRGERDTLRTRVAELEGHIVQRDAALESVVDRAATADKRVASLESQLESVADRAAAAETALEAAPAASGAAGTEPDAWGVRRNGVVDCVTHRLFRGMAERSVEQSGGTVIPLYAAPQPAPGWLTPKEQEAIMYLIANRSQFAPQTPHEERRNAASRVCHALLARSTPPEVVLPECPFTPESTHAMGWWEAIGKVKKALAAAGVKVKESN